MQTVKFARGDRVISKLVIGGGFVGGILLHADEADKIELLARAKKAGVNWIDTAPSYGNTVSETVIGELLQDDDLRQQFQISTKVRLDTDDLSDVAGQIRKSLEDSLTRLRMTSIPLLQLHNPLGQNGIDDEVLYGAGGVVETFNQLRSEGLIELAGYTAVGDPDACHKMAAHEDIDAAQIYYNMLNPSAGWAAPAGWSTTDFKDLLATCAANNVTALNIRVYAAGVLASNERHGREIPILPGADIASEERRVAAVQEAVAPEEANSAVAAVRFSLGEPRLDAIILGMAELSHFDLALEAYNKGPLSEDTIGRLEAVWRGNSY